MKQYNFQDWLNRKISDDPEVILAGKLEYLRLYLTDTMRELREKAISDSGTASPATGGATSSSVHAAIVHFSQQSVSVIESGTTFLKSDDPVAVRVRQVLGFRSIPEVVAQLEQIYRTCPEDEWRYAGGEVLAGSVQTVRAERKSSDEDSDIELQDLAESLLEKLAKIWVNQN